MRFSRALIPTSPAAPKAARSHGAALLARGGFAVLAAGRPAAWFPLGRRVLARLEALVASELEAIGSQEVDVGDLGAIALLRASASSHKQLPLALHQSRGGEVDVHTFDRDASWAASSRKRLGSMCKRVLEACGLPAATADDGARTLFWLAGEPAHMDIALDRRTGYAATADAAPRARTPRSIHRSVAPITTELTPGVKTVADVAAHLGVEPTEIVKTIIYEVDGELVAACVRGDRAVSVAQLARARGGRHVELASAERVEAATGCPPGFVGPVGLSIPVLADVDLEGEFSAICGANTADAHFRAVDLARDATIEAYLPLARARAGDTHPDSGETYDWIGARAVAAIESHGTALTEPNRCSVAGDAGAPILPHQCSASLSLIEIISAAADRAATETGIAWPAALAPFDVTVCVLHPGDAACHDLGERLYRELEGRGLSVLIDDRAGAVGSKLTDAELVGARATVVVGKRVVAAGHVEVRGPDRKASLEVSTEDATEELVNMLERRP